MKLLLYVTVFAVVTFLHVDAWQQCPTYWTLHGGSCYRYFSFKKTWVEAEKFCKLIGAPNGQGIAHLTSVHSTKERDFLYEHWSTHRDPIPENVEYTSNREYPGLWIGLNDIAENSRWVWTDGSNFDFEDWLPHEPNNCCGGETAVHFWEVPDGTGYQWNDIAHNSEDWKFPFICKMPSGIIPTCLYGFLYETQTGTSVYFDY